MTTFRQQSVERLRRRLLARGKPRLLMSLLIAATGAAGFLVSWALLRAGFQEMWIRYFLAVAAAYLVFLGLLGIWIALQRRRQSLEMDAGIDLWPDVFPAGAGGQGGPAGGFGGGGGNFGGAGANASFGSASTPPTSAAGGSGGGGGGGIDLGIDELFVVLAVAAAVLAAAAASVYLVVTAPALFAELLLDGILVGQLYRRLRRLDARHWLETALRRTALPFFATAVTVSLAGYAMQRLVPQAVSIGEVWKAITA